jgi:hypothetical protein
LHSDPDPKHTSTSYVERQNLNAYVNEAFHAVNAGAGVAARSTAFPIT